MDEGLTCVYISIKIGTNGRRCCLTAGGAINSFTGKRVNKTTCISDQKCAMVFSSMLRRTKSEMLADKVVRLLHYPQSGGRCNRQRSTTQIFARIDAVKADSHIVAFWENPSIARSDRGEIEDQIIDGVSQSAQGFHRRPPAQAFILGKSDLSSSKTDLLANAKSYIHAQPAGQFQPRWRPRSSSSIRAYSIAVIGTRIDAR